MRPAFIDIINIKETALLLPLIKSLPEILPFLLPEDLSEKKAFTGKLFKRLLEIWSESKNLSWKLLAEFVTVVPALHNFFAEHKFFEHFAEELSSIIRSANFQLKRQAAHSFCLLLRQNESYKKREKYLIDLLSLKSSSSYYERVGFLEYCSALIDHYSMLFIRNHDVVLKMLGLADDGVSGMRLRLARACVEAAGKVQEDLQRTIAKKVEEMRSDENKDVKCEAEKAAAAIADIISDSELQAKIMKSDLIKEQEENFLMEKVRRSTTHRSRRKRRRRRGASNCSQANWERQARRRTRPLV